MDAGVAKGDLVGTAYERDAAIDAMLADQRRRLDSSFEGIGGSDEAVSRQRSLESVAACEQDVRHRLKMTRTISFLRSTPSPDDSPVQSLV